MDKIHVLKVKQIVSKWCPFWQKTTLILKQTKKYIPGSSMLIWLEKGHKHNI